MPKHKKTNTSNVRTGNKSSSHFSWGRALILFAIFSIVGIRWLFTNRKNAVDSLLQTNTPTSSLDSTQHILQSLISHFGAQLPLVLADNSPPAQSKNPEIILGANDGMIQGLRAFVKLQTGQAMEEGTLKDYGACIGLSRTAIDYWLQGGRLSSFDTMRWRFLVLPENADKPNTLPPDMLQLMHEFADTIVFYQTFRVLHHSNSFEFFSPNPLSKNISKLNIFSGIYDEHALTNYFKTLEDQLSRFDVRVGFFLYTIKHAIAILYHTNTALWWLFDPEIIPVQSYTSKTIAAQILSTIDVKHPYEFHPPSFSLTMQIHPYVHSAHKKKLQSQFNALHQNLSNPANARQEKDSYHTPLLLIAILGGDEPMWRALLQDPNTDTNVSAEQPYNTPLLEAIYHKDIPAFDMILNHVRTNPNQKDSHGLSPLILCVEQGMSEEVKVLLSHPKIDPNQMYKDRSPLYRAIVMNSPHSLEMVIALLKHPLTDPNLGDKRFTPLIQAVLRNKIEVVRAVLENPKTRLDLSHEGSTVYDIARELGHNEILERLLEHGSPHRQEEFILPHP